MKNLKKIGLIFLLLCITAQPKVTHAYFTTGQTAVKIDDHDALFLIEYKFGHTNYDMYLPAVTERGLTSVSNEEKVGYTLVDSHKVVQTNGTTNGFVLSNVPIVNGMYKLEKGKAYKLWLAVLLTTDTVTPKMDYALQVTKLPFFMGNNPKKLQTLHLNPSELQYYVTKGVELNQTKLK